MTWSSWLPPARWPLECWWDQPMNAISTRCPTSCVEVLAQRHPQTLIHTCGSPPGIEGEHATGAVEEVPVSTPSARMPNRHAVPVAHRRGTSGVGSPTARGGTLANQCRVTVGVYGLHYVLLPSIRRSSSFRVGLDTPNRLAVLDLLPFVSRSTSGTKGLQLSGTMSFRRRRKTM